MISDPVKISRDPVNHRIDGQSRLAVISSIFPLNVKDSTYKYKVLKKARPKVKKSNNPLPAAGILTDVIIEGIVVI
jgi:hypothetical protein